LAYSLVRKKKQAGFTTACFLYILLKSYYCALIVSTMDIFCIFLIGPRTAKTTESTIINTIIPSSTQGIAQGSPHLEFISRAKRALLQINPSTVPTTQPVIA